MRLAASNEMRLAVLEEVMLAASDVVRFAALEEARLAAPGAAGRNFRDDCKVTLLLPSANHRNHL